MQNDDIEALFEKARQVLSRTSQYAIFWLEDMQVCVYFMGKVAELLKQKLWRSMTQRRRISGWSANSWQAARTFLLDVFWKTIMQ